MSAVVGYSEAIVRGEPAISCPIPDGEFIVPIAWVSTANLDINEANSFGPVDFDQSEYEAHHYAGALLPMTRAEALAAGTPSITAPPGYELHGVMKMVGLRGLGDQLYPDGPSGNDGGEDWFELEVVFDPKTFPMVVIQDWCIIQAWQYSGGAQGRLPTSTTYTVDTSHPYVELGGTEMRTLARTLVYEVAAQADAHILTTVTFATNPPPDPVGPPTIENGRYADWQGWSYTPLPESVLRHLRGSQRHRWVD